MIPVTAGHAKYRKNRISFEAQADHLAGSLLPLAYNLVHASSSTLKGQLPVCRVTGSLGIGTKNECKHGAAEHISRSFDTVVANYGAAPL